MTQEQAPNFTNDHWAELFHNNVSSCWISFWKFHWSDIPGRDRHLNRDSPGQTVACGRSTYYGKGFFHSVYFLFNECFFKCCQICENKSWN